MKWITCTPFKNVIRAHAMTRIPPLMIRRKTLQHVRLHRILAAASQAKWFPSTDARAINQDLRFYDLAISHEALVHHARACSLPTHSNGITLTNQVPGGGIKEFKLKTLNEYWTFANHNRLRIIPTGYLEPAIYACKQLPNEGSAFRRPLVLAHTTWTHRSRDRQAPYHSIRTLDTKTRNQAIHQADKNKCTTLPTRKRTRNARKTPVSLGTSRKALAETTLRSRTHLQLSSDQNRLIAICVL